MKPKIAIFSLTGCEGCSLSILELEDRLLDILDAVDVVNFREAMSERDWSFDIAFVDGAVSTAADEEEVRRIRAACKTLVAIGSCACLGGINTLKNHRPLDDARRYVYGDRWQWFATTDARPVSAVVKVDYELPGCPMVKEEFLELVTCLLANKPFRLPQSPVCVECKKRGLRCLYETGQICLGPVTRGGCNAICPAFGSKCEGCRGLVSQEAMAAAGFNLRELYHVSLDDVLASFRLYGAYQEGELP
jgi:sulfhydrogenase subunit delta